MIKFWDWINGNKTVICSTAYMLLSEAVKADILQETKGVNFAIGLTLTLGGGSLFHRIKKRVTNKK